MEALSHESMVPSLPVESWGRRDGSLLLAVWGGTRHPTVMPVWASYEHLRSFLSKMWAGHRKGATMTVQATDPRSGWFTFVHHDRPLEYSWDIEERIQAIVTTKPAHEIATRLRCLAFVPETEIPFATREAQRALDEAQRAAWADDGLALALRYVPNAPWDLKRKCLVFLP